MKKYILLFLLGTLFCACSSDDGEGVPFVTDVAIPAGAGPFSPGDEVTVTARGFEADDGIMLRITWPLANEAISEGLADGVWCVVTARTESDITFLAPGGYPAGTAEVKLFRRGRVMTLGRISVSDGTPPAAYSLYGITNSPRGEVHIDKTDLKTGRTSRTAQFAGVLTHPLNRAGSNCIFGLSSDGGRRSAAYYDLTMRYFKNSAGDRIITDGFLFGAEVSYLLCQDNTCIFMGLTGTRTSLVVPPSWQLPEGVEPEMLTRYPFVMDDGAHVLLSVRRDGQTYLPMAFNMRSEGAGAKLGDPVSAEEMVPFWIVDPETHVVGADYSVRCGFAVVKDGRTELRMYDPAAMAFGDVMATVPAAVRSVACVTFPDRDAGQCIYMLCDTGDGQKQVRVYDRATDMLLTLAEEVPYSEIVLAR